MKMLDYPLVVGGIFFKAGKDEELLVVNTSDLSITMVEANQTGLKDIKKQCIQQSCTLLVTAIATTTC